MEKQRGTQERILQDTTMRFATRKITKNRYDKPADLDSHLFTPRKSSGDEVKDFCFLTRGMVKNIRACCDLLVVIPHTGQPEMMTTNLKTPESGNSLGFLWCSIEHNCFYA
ncbi:MAG: hypothetical protein ACOX1S_03990 [Anaerostipes sp.]